MTAQAQAYAKVVAQLQGAARGRWVGPAIAPGVLNQALSTTAGLDTKALVGQVSAAVGKSGPQGLSGGIMDQILRLLGQIAVGTISSGIASIIEDWARGRKDAKDFEKSGRDAACAIDRIDKGCSTSSSAIIEVMGQAVGLLCVQLRLLEPMCGPAHAAAFASVLRIATTLIDCAGRLVMDTCHDRDDAIKGCFELLLKRGDALCEAPSRPVPGESSEDTCPQPPAQECPAPETPKTPKTPNVPAPAPSPAPAPAPETPAPAPAPQAPEQPQAPEKPQQPAPPAPQAPPLAEPTVPQDQTPPASPTTPPMETGTQPGSGSGQTTIAGGLAMKVEGLFQIAGQLAGNGLVTAPASVVDVPVAPTTPAAPSMGTHWSEQPPASTPPVLTDAPVPTPTNPVTPASTTGVAPAHAAGAVSVTGGLAGGVAGHVGALGAAGVGLACRGLEALGGAVQCAVDGAHQVAGLVQEAALGATGEAAWQASGELTIDAHAQWSCEQASECVDSAQPEDTPELPDQAVPEAPAPETPDTAETPEDTPEVPEVVEEDHEPQESIPDEEELAQVEQPAPPAEKLAHTQVRATEPQEIPETPVSAGPDGGAPEEADDTPPPSQQSADEVHNRHEDPDGASSKARKAGQW
ncbi:hypothetical protein ACUY3K_03435 [Corynebacterium uberis]|nr:hypothetical protein [Corynebacterium uberis]MCZ9309356.1 hypothetical protein [Corynebacterium sp. c6VSa_13]UDL72905.1 hypothetical protein LH391_07225 [Corynebacterium uberis]UDL76218.1 hypothetical protein LH393_02170 [Corynebacterium uberis]UDL78430.1 hypothetical protein LH394_02160 [Corynebacterium uberis]UDL85055.1 hypothetical protein LH390_02165 [Corynebacterium uberis]